MSQFLTGLAQLNPQVKRHNGGTSTLTLDQNGTTNATLLFINGVAQSPGTDFSVSGATLSTSSELPAGTNIATTIQYFNTGIVSAPADNSVTGAKLDVSLVQGDVLTATGTDTLARLAKGTANQKLSMNSAGNAVEWQTAAASGGYEYVSSATASSSASLTFSGLVDGFDYQVIATQVVFSGTGSHPSWRVGIADGTIRTSGYVSQGTSFETSTNHATSSGTAAFEVRHVATATTYEQTYKFDFIAPMTSGTKTSMLWLGSGRGSSNSANFLGGGVYGTAEANERIQFFHTTANITSGLFKLYKRPNT